LYIDGGKQYWLPGLQDGTYASPISDGKNGRVCGSRREF
jgi:hypothetical protein